MNHSSIEMDNSARSILKTYQQINDNTLSQRNPIRSKLKQKTLALEKKIHQLTEENRSLQSALTQSDQRLLHLNQLLSDKTDNMQRLQEDYENAIYHFQQVSKNLDNAKP